MCYHLKDALENPKLLGEADSLCLSWALICHCITNMNTLLLESKNNFSTAKP